VGIAGFFIKYSIGHTKETQRKLKKSTIILNKTLFP